jgi:hypothetical protein
MRIRTVVRLGSQFGLDEVGIILRVQRSELSCFHRQPSIFKDIELRFAWKDIDALIKREFHTNALLMF